ncbi:MOSC domain-containing protein [Vreelandella sp. EE22]
MKIDQLTIYPVKSLQGIDLDESAVTAQGLAWDRCWMWVDRQQRFVTQRQLPALSTVSVALTRVSLVLSHPKVGDIEIPLEPPKGPIRLVTVWRDHCKALAERDEISDWLVRALGEQAEGLSLVRFASGFKRPVEADFLDGDLADTHFADGYPFLVTTTGSLDALNQALEANRQAPVPMARFRPNIVIDCPAAWAENAWQLIDIDGDTIRLVVRKPCKRCTIITVDQRLGTISTPAEPLSTLVKLKTQPGLKGAYFGQNATLGDGEGAIIRVGAGVTPTSRV